MAHRRHLFFWGFQTWRGEACKSFRASDPYHPYILTTQRNLILVYSLLDKIKKLIIFTTNSILQIVRKRFQNICCCRVHIWVRGRAAMCWVLGAIASKATPSIINAKLYRMSVHHPVYCPSLYYMTWCRVGYSLWNGTLGYAQTSLPKTRRWTFFFFLTRGLNPGSLTREAAPLPLCHRGTILF